MRKEINMLRQLRLVLPLALVAFALGLAAPARGVIAIIVDWRPLTGDLTTLVPPVLRTSLLAKLDAAAIAAERDQFCVTARILDALERELQANGNAGIGDPNVIGDGSVRTLEADIAVVRASLPPDPCLGDPPIQTDPPVDSEIARPLGEAGPYR